MATGPSDRATLNGLLDKLEDPDPDLRYMSLNDLLALLKNKNSAWLTGEITYGGKVVDGILKALQDQNGEVQNMALKWYGALLCLRCSKLILTIFCTAKGLSSTDSERKSSRLSSTSSRTSAVRKKSTPLFLAPLLSPSLHPYLDR